MDNNTYTNSKVNYIDQEQLKILAGIIKRYANDLKTIKKKSDEIWEQCSSYLEDGTIANINIVKSNNYVKYNSSIDELINYANRIETVANIWDETEREINASSKKLESYFSDVSKTVKDAFERSRKQ